VIGRTLAHYRITAVIGAGGMGQVYRATDTKLGREVALKVLPAEMASNQERLARFRREAQALAALDHPGIVTVYSVEEADGVHFLTMQLVEGQPLDRIIPGSGLPRERLLAIAISLAEALAVAHEKGVVHRDLKPANVMALDDGRVKVLDFGLAKIAVQQEAAESALPTEARTRDGVVMGTVPYMSPEQVSGRPVDHRTDIFSLGILLHEMATGRRPFAGDSHAELASAILREVPPPVTDRRVDLPSALAEVIDRCLEKDPERRPQSAREIVDALRQISGAPSQGARAERSPDSGGARAEEGLGVAERGPGRRWLWIGVGVAAIVVAVGIGYVATRRGSSTESAREAAGARSAAPVSVPVATVPDRSIAVLPFADMSEKKDQEYFADGLAEELMGMLSRVPSLKVAARTSSFYFKGRQATTAEIAKTLGVGHLLEGSVRKSGDRLRVSAQLVRAADGFQLWSETFDRRLDDVFQVQDEIANAVVKALEVTLLEGDMPKAAATHSQEAYSLFLQARQLHYRGTHADNLTGISYLERAIKLDPNFAPAWFGLGDALVYDYVQFGSETHAAVRRRAGEAAETALRLDPNLADAHLLMGRVLGELDWNWPAADAELRRAVELDPNNMLALWMSSVYALVGDRLDEALRFANRVQAVDAISWGSYWAMGDVQWRMGDVADAEASYRKAAELNPTSGAMHAWLGITLLRQGRPEEALTEMQRETDEGWKLYGLALTLDALERRAEADRAMTALESTMADTRAWSIASLYACRGELDKAFSWLDRAYRLRDGQLPLIQADPCVGFLEPDPRYAELRKKVKLPASAR